MAFPEDRELVGRLARRAVGDLAPQELPLFDATCRAYFANPSLARRQGARETLDFGVDEAVMLITPAALVAATEVVRFVTAQVGELVREEAGGIIQSWLRRVWQYLRPRRRKGERVETPPLTAAQRDAVRQVAFEAVSALAVPQEQARLVADAIVGGLSGASRVE